MLTIGLVGLGLTGSIIAQYLLQERADSRVVVAGAGPHSEKAGVDLGTVCGLAACGVMVTAADDLPAALRAARPQVVIDFSRPEATQAFLDVYVALGCGVVVGTTGFSDEEMQRLRLTGEQEALGILYAPNITRGVNVLMLLARLAAEYLPYYDIEVIEQHHRRKRDAPSGTAKRLADELHDAQGQEGETVFGREGKATRDLGEIGVHAVRAGGIVGVHEVLFAGEHDELVITHRTESRRAFAVNAVSAAHWIAGRRGFFTMEDVILTPRAPDG